MLERRGQGLQGEGNGGGCELVDPYGLPSQEDLDRMVEERKGKNRESDFDFVLLPDV